MKNIAVFGTALVRINLTIIEEFKKRDNGAVLDELVGKLPVKVNQKTGERSN